MRKRLGIYGLALAALAAARRRLLTDIAGGRKLEAVSSEAAALVFAADVAPVVDRAPPPSEPRAAGARRLLIVDDNQDSARSLARLLQMNGNETHVAYDGLEAVDLARSCRPDVILLDIGLPNLNGYDACRRIRAEAWGQRIMMVAFSGWGQEEDRRESKAAGFDAHLVKPVDYADLTALLAGRPVSAQHT